MLSKKKTCKKWHVPIAKTCKKWHVPIARRISERLGCELKRRNIAYSFGASDYWLWNVIGSIIVVGPFVYYHKLFKAANLICADYNEKG